MTSNIRRIEKDTEEDRKLNELFVTPVRTGFVEVGEDKFVIPIYYEKYGEDITKFEVRDDDIYLAAHPKTGTTWLGELIYLLVNDFDYVAAVAAPAQERIPFLEAAAIIDIEKINADFNTDANTLNIMANKKSPRFIKTHLPWSLLPEQIQNGTKKPKIIVTLRNAHDTCVSFYHFSKIMHGYKGGFEEFCKLFLAGRVIFGPFWKHTLGYWQERDRPNILFVKYKDMKADFPAIIRKVADFLGKPVTEDQIKKLMGHLSFQSMKKNPTVNKEAMEDYLKKYNLGFGDGDLVRSGKEGGYKSEMSPALIEEFDVWIRENTAGTGLIL